MRRKTKCVVGRQQQQKKKLREKKIEMLFVIYGNVLRSREICYKCLSRSHTQSVLSLSLAPCVNVTHKNVLQAIFQLFFLCVFVHSFNYLGIKYDEPSNESRSRAAPRPFTVPLPVGQRFPSPKQLTLYGPVSLCLFRRSLGPTKVRSDVGANMRNIAFYRQLTKFPSRHKGAQLVSTVNTRSERLQIGNGVGMISN